MTPGKYVIKTEKKNEGKTKENKGKKMRDERKKKSRREEMQAVKDNEIRSGNNMNQNIKCKN